MKVRLEVNDVPVEVDVPALAPLMDVLRDELGLTGVKEGCAAGECGACTVLLDGVPVMSCLVAVAQAGGHAVSTVEGMAHDGVPGPVQQALVDHGAVQCGSCIPGIVMSATAAAAREPGASRERVRELLAGNLCRCTGYRQVVDAVVEALAGEAVAKRARR